MSSDFTASNGNLGRFQPGNPGRPKGSRNKLGEAFVQALYEDWQANGVDVITKVREQRPQDYLRVIASIMPKDVNLNFSAMSDVSDEDIAHNLETIRALAAFLRSVEAGGGDEEDARGGDGATPAPQPHRLLLSR